MPKEEWGVKRICPTSGKHFYDMNKKPIVSPYTGETVTLDANTRTRVAVAEKPAPVVEKDLPEEDEVLLEENSEEAATDSDLLDDDDENDTVSLDEIKDVPANDAD